MLGITIIRFGGAGGRTMLFDMPANPFAGKIVKTVRLERP